MRTYDAWFPGYALGNGLMFFCRVFSPAVGRGSSALSTFLDRRTQRVKQIEDIYIKFYQQVKSKHIGSNRDAYHNRLCPCCYVSQTIVIVL